MPTFCIVWLLRNLSLDGKLCLRDDKNAAYTIFQNVWNVQQEVPNDRCGELFEQKITKIGQSNT